MRVSGHSLGQATCGTNPCGFFDYFDTSDQCLAYLNCTGGDVSSLTLGSSISSVATGAANLVGSAAAAATSNLTSDLMFLAIAALVIIGVVVSVKV